MKVCLNKTIFGTTIQGENSIKRKHAEPGDVLDVILNNPTHYICDSKHFPGEHIVVFHNQGVMIAEEADISIDDHADEKYYHVYEDNNKTDLDDPFYNAFEYED